MRRDREPNREPLLSSEPIRQREDHGRAAYGSEGYNIIQDTASYPSYVSVTPASVSSWTWAASTTDVRGLQKAASGTDRIAALLVYECIPVIHGGFELLRYGDAPGGVLLCGLG